MQSWRSRNPLLRRRWQDSFSFSLVLSVFLFLSFCSFRTLFSDVHFLGVYSQLSCHVLHEVRLRPTTPRARSYTPGTPPTRIPGQVPVPGSAVLPRDSFGSPQDTAWNRAAGSHNQEKIPKLALRDFVAKRISKIQGRAWAFGEAEARLQVGGSVTVAPAE